MAVNDIIGQDAMVVWPNKFGAEPVAIDGIDGWMPSRKAGGRRGAGE